MAQPRAWKDDPARGRRDPADLPHDVLAAEEFGMGTPDPVLHHHGPVALPSDPTGILEPHDVLAAEEFALPAPPRAASTGSGSSAHGVRGRAVAAIGAMAAVALLVRRRRG